MMKLKILQKKIKKYISYVNINYNIQIFNNYFLIYKII